MVKTTHTEIAAVGDSDVLVSSKQILEVVNLIRNKKADFVVSYKEKFLDISKIVRELYFKTCDINVLIENNMEMKEPYAPHSVGEGVFANRKAYLASGLENVFFIAGAKKMVKE